MEENETIEYLKKKILQLEKKAELYLQTKNQLDAIGKKFLSAQNLLSNIVDGNPLPIFILDKNHKVIYWNQTFEKISGIKAHDIIGTNEAWRAFYDEKRPVMADLIIDGVDEEKFWDHYRHNTEYTTLHKSALKEGAYESQDFFPRFGKNGMWLLANACPLTDVQGNVIGAMETFQDVTNLINAQKESRKNEEKYVSLFENAGDAFFLMDYDRLIDCNALALKIFNCSHEDILGNSIFDFSRQIQPDGQESKEEFQEKITRAYGGKSQRFYWKFSGLFAKEFDANVTLSRVEIHGRHVLQAVVRDITKHVKAEKELSTLRKYLSNIINSMPSLLIGINEKGKITHWNFKAEQYTGVNASIAVGQNISRVFPRLKDEMGKIKDTIKNKKILEETKIPNEDKGEVYYENLTVYPLSENGVKGAVIRIDDVTDQVRIEEMMIQSEKMLSLGSLAAGMAHEINNPLAGMMQNAQVMINRLSTDMPANEKIARQVGVSMDVINAYMEKRKILKFAEVINESGKRAAKIIRNMLSFAKKSESKKRSYNLSEVLDKTIEIACSDYDLKTDYDFKQIEIIREYDTSVPAVYCDESKIQQVFWNILRNGAEAMQETDDQSKFYLRIYQSFDMVCVEIKDNGPGMDKKIRKRLFEPFFTTKGKEKGTGLGLAVSYFIIVKDHGGQISIESDKGAGSKFIIQLKI
ncbi:MAG: PAS domain S-box protein [Desulfobacula sp.]|nr:PAS domain S-box protein [Desulfobacula sp.]